MAKMFDPEVISKIQGYSLRARRIVEGFVIGVHRSRLLGTGLEFKQHREYVQGDDTRRLDWKVFARTDRYFIRQYESETNMACQILLDCSESMQYKGEAPMSKFEYAATAAVSLAYLLLLDRDSVGFTFFDEKVRMHMPPKATFSQFYRAVDVLEGMTPGNRTMTGGALSAVAGHLKRRSMVIILSDFLDEVPPIAFGLNRLGFDGHEVLAINVADPLEVEFPFSGPALLEGLEKAGDLRCDPSDFRELYLESRAAHLEELRSACRRLRFDLNEMVTSAPLDEALSGILTERGQTVAH
jgi:uncharacterized protein (DUF58 family)